LTAARPKPPPTPAPKIPVNPEPDRYQWDRSDKRFFGGMAAFVAALVALLVYGVTRKPGPCIGWEPWPPVYRLMPDGRYRPEPRWLCVEREDR
jgi:hypothetical protein